MDDRSAEIRECLAKFVAYFEESIATPDMPDSHTLSVPFWLFREAKDLLEDGPCEL